MFIQPKAGLKIRDPLLKDFLPEEGRQVEYSHYWQRRLIDGDVISMIHLKKTSKILQNENEKLKNNKGSD